MTTLLTRASFFRRIFCYLFFLLFLQCLIAYGALIVFDALPQWVTGVPDDHVVQWESQRGAVSLIRAKINEQPNRPAGETVKALQTQFGYPIQVLPANFTLPTEIKNELIRYGTGYDEENDILYAVLDNQEILQLGPLLLRDILESDLMPFGVFIFIWAIFSACISFILLYFSFSHFWKDFVSIRQTAEQFSHGNLKARTDKAKSWLLKPLSTILNSMGVYIEHLVTTSQTISHAMAHELRTPLARIRFELRMLDEAKDDVEKLEFRKGIDEDLNELESLINASLSYFKMQHSNIELEYTEVSLKPWSEAVCQSLTLLKPKEFLLDCQSESGIVNLDSKLAEMIIKNLLLNAFKYADHHAILEISRKDNYVVIIVDDDGAGIPLELRENVFLPFSRLDTSRTRSTGGYGLGLAYVKLMSEFHGGNTFVVTSPLGGARFVVTLEVKE